MSSCIILEQTIPDQIVQSLRHSDAPERFITLILEALRKVDHNDLNAAVLLLNEILDHKMGDGALLVPEAYALRAHIYFMWSQRSKACADLRRAETWMMGKTPGAILKVTDGALMHMVGAMAEDLRPHISGPLPRHPARSFKMESNFALCLEVLRMWASGQRIDMPEDPASVAALRFALQESFDARCGTFLLIRPDIVPQAVFVSSQAAYAAMGPPRWPTFENMLLFSEDDFTRRRGMTDGVPEGYLFRIVECITFSAGTAFDRGAQRNPLARELLRLEDDILGPVLVRTCWMLKHRNRLHSRIVCREAPTEAFLRSGKWETQRSKWVALSPGLVERGHEYRPDPRDMSYEFLDPCYHIHA